MTHDTQWDGRPENSERDSDGHVLRVNGGIDVYRWVALNGWYQNSKGLWATPHDLISYGDIYCGRILTRAEVEARVAEARLKALEEAAKIAEGEVYLYRYRTWPWWQNPDGTKGNRANESELVKHCDVIAAAIRALMEKNDE